MGNVSTLSIAINGSAEGLKKASEEAEHILKGMADKAESFFKSVVDWGAKATLAAGALTTAFGVKGVKSFGDFESQLKTIQAVSTDLSEKQLKDLTDRALELGAKFPVSARDAAQGFAELSKAGFKANEIMAASKGLVTLATAGNLDMARSAEIVAGTIRGFGLTADQTGHVVDILAQTANQSAVDVSDLAETFKYAAGPAKAAGYSLEDLSVAAGLMGNSMIKGSDAGTALRAIIVRLNDPPKDAASAMEQLGLSVTNANGSMKPFSQIMGEMRTKFAGLSESQQVQMASSIAGQEAMSGLLAVVKASPADFNDMTTAVQTATGAADRMAETMNSGVKGALDNLSGSVETLEIKFGQGLAPGVEKALGKLADFANYLGPTAEKFGAFISNSLIRAIDYFDRNRVAILGLVDKFESLGLAVLKLNSIFNPLSYVLTALEGYIQGGFSGAIAALETKLGGLWAHFRDAIPDISKVRPKAEALFDDLGKWVIREAPILAGYLKIWGEEFADWVLPAGQKMIAKVDGLGQELLKWVVNHKTQIADRLIGWKDSFIDWIVPVGGLLGGKVTGLVGELLGWVSGHKGGIEAELKSWGDTFANFLPEIGRFIDKGVMYLSNILGWVTEHTPQILDKLGEWTGAFVNWIGPALGEIGAKILEFATRVANYVSDHKDEIGKALKSWSLAFLNWAEENVTPFAEAVGRLFGSMVDEVIKNGKPILDKFITVGQGIGHALGKGIIDSMPPLVGFFAKGMLALSDAGSVAFNLITLNAEGARKSFGDFARDGSNLAADAVGWLPGMSGIANVMRGIGGAVDDVSKSVDRADGRAKTFKETIDKASGGLSGFGVTVGATKTQVSIFADQVQKLQDQINGTDKTTKMAREAMEVMDDSVTTLDPKVQSLWGQFKKYAENTFEGGTQSEYWHKKAGEVLGQIGQLNPSMLGLADAYQKNMLTVVDNQKAQDAFKGKLDETKKASSDYAKIIEGSAMQAILKFSGSIPDMINKLLEQQGGLTVAKEKADKARSAVQDYNNQIVLTKTANTNFGKVIDDAYAAVSAINYFNAVASSSKMTVTTNPNGVTIINGYAEGTPPGGHPGGPALVGEGRWPEMVMVNRPTLIPNLPRGAQVVPLIGGQGGASAAGSALPPVNIYLTVNGNPDPSMLAEMERVAKKAVEDGIDKTGRNAKSNQAFGYSGNRTA
jgi:TP901 family phage tail tape measure protein